MLFKKYNFNLYFKLTTKDQEILRTETCEW